MTAAITRYFDEQPTPELTYLAQIAGIDSEDATILSRQPVRNGSGREIGEILVVSDETWDSIQESLKREKETEE